MVGSITSASLNLLIAFSCYDIWFKATPYKFKASAIFSLSNWAVTIDTFCLKTGSWGLITAASLNLARAFAYWPLLKN